ncbi:nucleotidyl transferase AbiEii/AbiGii toxin family protein [Methylobacterium oryzisoli]|uniref:nucleotidyl transferase AbiEii/AbiGii toxin family protein n=1 Tax=Methylobacterium oryzisoli TaxID=3385502 RepID=UPI00389129AD
MADAFLQLSAEDRREALEFAASRSGRPAHLLEKDVWVVWSLGALFASPLGDQLVFKGGTSLSKAYRAIRRFSEDVDLTYDIRAIAPDLVADAEDALPTTRSAEKRWTSEIRKRLPQWVTEQALPVVTTRLRETGVPAEAVAVGEKIFVAYDATAAGTGYVRPAVMLEFGARSTGEPCAPFDIDCDAAEMVEGLVFPQATARVMRAERTFWEKATAAHVYCRQGKLRGRRFARHWYDLARLDDAGIAAAAIADLPIAQAVAAHKAMFFVERDNAGATIDYKAAVQGHLVLAPQDGAREALAEDYRGMIEDGLLLDEGEPFDTLMDRCADLAARANAAAAA